MLPFSQIYFLNPRSYFPNVPNYFPKVSKRQ